MPGYGKDRLKAPALHGHKFQVAHDEWCNTTLTAREIANKLGLHTNHIIGWADRYAWPNRVVLPQLPTLFSRLDSLHERLDQVLAESYTDVRDRGKKGSGRSKRSHRKGTGRAAPAAVAECAPTGAGDRLDD